MIATKPTQGNKVQYTIFGYKHIKSGVVNKEDEI
jgi:hypothetical protein